MKKTSQLLALALAFSSQLRAGENLAQQFQNPPVESRAGAYWWWVNAFVDKAGITHDLEEFKAKGISSVLLVNSSQHADAFYDKGPDFLSPEWRELYRHALQEAARLGIAVDVNMAPGWNMGGKWVVPEKASRWYLQSETSIKGPQKFSGKLPMPQPNDGYNSPMCYGARTSFNVPAEKMDYRDTAVVAFRTPEGGKPAPRQNLDAKANRVGGDCSLPADRVNNPPLVPWVSSPEDRPVKPGEVVDLTSKLKPDGTLEWDVPEGDWTIVRTGHRMTNAQLSVPMPGFRGLENDFLDRAGINQIYDAVGTELVKEAGPLAGKTLRSFVTDSFEAGYPNWTANILERFKTYRGYDPTPYLPALSGWIVGSAEISDRFLHDYRKTVGDCFADEHYGRMTELARQNGMMTRAEAAGPSQSGTVCTDALKNLGRVDFPMGEFWRFGSFVQGDQNMVCKQTASAAHIYGKRYAATESFTAFHRWRNWDASPDLLKPLLDRAFCEGINQIFFHSSTCQRRDYGKPGIVYNAGTHVNPRVSWWEQTGGPWISYINRSQSLLQSGLFAADALYYVGDGAPNLIPPKHVPAGLGKGYDYDACNEEVLLTRLSVKDGRIVLPDGMSYRVLVLPKTTKMPAPVAQKLRELVQAGATVIGPKPLTDPGLKNHPQCDDEVKKIGEELWGGKTGKGRVFADKTEREVLLADGVLPDFEAAGAPDTFIDFIHRTTPEAEIYFLANRKDRPEKITATFRQTGRQPELWNPMTGGQRDLPQFKMENGRTTVPLEFDPNGSMFVVFRKPTTATAGEGSNFPTFATAQTLEGPWTVQFDKDWFYPATNNVVVFDKLEDWINRPEDAVKHFSGTAVYKKTFPVSALPSPGSKTFLDLGTVGHSAKVRLNGKDLGVVWSKPWRVDITEALKSGDNELEIEVVNSWPNRLIGDAKLPKEQRRSRTNITQYEKPESQTLVPSGLFGPVSLSIAK